MLGTSRCSIILCWMSEELDEDCDGGGRDSWPLPLGLVLPSSWVTPFILPLQPQLYLILGVVKRK